MFMKLKIVMILMTLMKLMLMIMILSLVILTIINNYVDSDDAVNNCDDQRKPVYIDDRDTIDDYH